MRSRSLVAALILLATPIFAREIAVTEAEYRPARSGMVAIAGSGDSYMTVWTSSDDRLFSHALDRDGRPVGQTNLIGFGAEDPQVVWIGDRFRVVFAASDYRFGVFDHVEVLDLDPMGRLIEGSRLELPERLYGQRIATDGHVTFVAGKSRGVDYTLTWYLIDRSGSFRKGSIWIGHFFDTRAVYARGTDFGVLWTSGGGLYRFELSGGRIQAVSGHAGTYAATAIGEVTWIATASRAGAAVTLLHGPETRLIKFESKSAIIRGVYAMHGQAVIHASVEGRETLYRFADDGTLLQQFDMPPNMTTSSIAAGDDTIVAVGPRAGSLASVSLRFGAEDISGPAGEALISELADSKRGPAVASIPDRTLVVWREDRAPGEEGERLRGVVLDPLSGARSEPFVVSDPMPRGRYLARPVGSRFLVWHESSPDESRVTLIGPDGDTQRVQAFASMDIKYVEDWAWTESAFVAVSQNYDAVFLTVWDGLTSATTREVAHAEDPGEDAWSIVASPRVETGRDTVLVTWSSLVSRCFFPTCHDPRQAFGRLFDRQTLEPLTDAFPIGPRDHYEDVETAWNGTHYGIWLESRGELFRLTETGELVDDDPIELRGHTNRSFEPVSSLESVDGSFVVSWLEETWTHWSGVVSRVVYADGSLSPLHAFPILTEDRSIRTSSSGTGVFLTYAARTFDEEFLGAERIFVRALTDMPLASPPRSPRLMTAFQVGGDVTLEWEDQSDDEIFFEIAPSYDQRSGSCNWALRPADTTSATVTCYGEGPFAFRIVSWNAAGYGEPSENVQAAPPHRRRPVRP